MQATFVLSFSVSTKFQMMSQHLELVKNTKTLSFIVIITLLFTYKRLTSPTLSASKRSEQQVKKNH